MKRILSLLFFVLLLACGASAQAPPNFNYQAALRDGAGNAMTNVNVTLRFTIHQLQRFGRRHICCQPNATACANQQPTR